LDDRRDSGGTQRHHARFQAREILEPKYGLDN